MDLDGFIGNKLRNSTEINRDCGKSATLAEKNEYLLTLERNRPVAPPVVNTLFGDLLEAPQGPGASQLAALAALAQQSKNIVSEETLCLQPLEPLGIAISDAPEFQPLQETPGTSMEPITP